jgi:hypothetical protein
MTLAVMVCVPERSVCVMLAPVPRLPSRLEVQAIEPLSGYPARGRGARGEGDHVRRDEDGVVRRRRDRDGRRGVHVQRDGRGRGLAAVVRNGGRDGVVARGELCG